ncbi:MAG: phosphotransferase [Bdellovibrionales bacterium]|nr:phosphotransferase [Bdellovibrionales bacterium]
MDAESILQAALSAERGASPPAGFTVTRLTGDASPRRYFRVTNGRTSHVMMLADPFEPARNTFLQVQRFLEERGVRCPRVHAVDGPSGAILLDDLGDRLMNTRLGLAKNATEEKTLYKKAVDLLLDFHSLTSARPLPGGVDGFALAFDVEKLMSEIDFTIEHWNGGHLRRDFTDAEKAVIRAEFLKICRRLAKEPRVFTHRDYHSRNIMVGRKGGLACIDFQDARMGLRQYDLASLLRDSYYRLPEATVEELVDHYIRGVARREKVRLARGAFVKTFDLTALQRNFKAVGSFCSFHVKRGDSSYLQYVGHTLENMRRTLLKYPELRRLREVLFGG